MKLIKVITAFVVWVGGFFFPFWAINQFFELQNGVYWWTFPSFLLWSLVSVVASIAVISLVTMWADFD